MLRAKFIEASLDRELAAAEMLCPAAQILALAMTNYDVLIAPSSFGESGSEPLELLNRAGLSYLLNPHKRKLTECELISLAAQCKGIIAGLEAYSPTVLQQCPQLRCISRCGVGMDNIDIEHARTRGISTYNTPDAPTDAVAELTVGLMLALVRRITLADSRVKGGHWSKYVGSLLRGKTVGVVGYGRIGRRVVQLLEPFRTTILIHDPISFVTGDNVHIQNTSLPLLLEDSDIVTLHLSWDSQRPYLLGKEELDLMKPGSYLINVARGGIVDEKALYNKLIAGQLGGAALDVFEREPYMGDLVKLENVVLTPHIGSYAKEARLRMEVETVENLVRGLS